MYIIVVWAHWHDEEPEYTVGPFPDVASADEYGKREVGESTREYLVFALNKPVSADY